MTDNCETQLHASPCEEIVSSSLKQQDKLKIHVLNHLTVEIPNKKAFRFL